MKALKQIKWLVLSLIIVLSACSSTQQAFLQNIKLYLASNEAVTISNQQIISSPVDLSYIKNGDRPGATMALAFIENGEYKWLSGDDAMFITVKGRVIRTLGFAENLLFTSNIEGDPIAEPTVPLIQSRTWTRQIDTEVLGTNDFGAELISVFSEAQNSTIQIQDIEFPVFEIQELVTYASVVNGSKTWTNRFYYDRDTKRLLKSIQTLAPDIDTLEITYLSRALRLVKPDLAEVGK